MTSETYCAVRAATINESLYLYSFVRFYLLKRMRPAQAVSVVPRSRSAIAMAPKQKPICEFGSVQQRSPGQWRATLKIDGKSECGPTRFEKWIAEADLQLTRKASNKSEMAACLQRLKHEAATAKEAPDRIAELESEVRCEIKARMELARENAKLRWKIRKLENPTSVDDYD